MKKVLSIFASLVISSNAFAHRLLECGVESYQLKTDAGLCGYIEKRSSACPAETYALKQSLQCPGISITEDYSGTACAAGDYEVRQKKDTVCAHWVHTPVRMCMGTAEVITKFCMRASNVPSCRLPENGVELYSSCRATSHGAETCEDPNQPIYRDCARYRREEISQFIQSASAPLEPIARAFLSHTSVIALEQMAQPALYCIIDQYHGDVFASAVVEKLKTQYTAIFGEDYAPGTYDCSDESVRAVEVPVLENGQCAPNWRREYCNAVKGYRTSFDLLTKYRADANAMLNDILAKSDPTVKSELEGFVNREEFNVLGK